jgi:hypothetical protein
MVDDSDWAGRAQLIGLRFPELNVPRGATIDDAFVRFTVDESDDRRTSLRIAGQATGDASPFRSEDYDISRRQKTAARVSWQNIPSWREGQWRESPDLSSVVQEIVDGRQWNRGNALVLIIGGTGKRTAHSYDGDRQRAPTTLHVTYSVER